MLTGVLLPEKEMRFWPWEPGLGQSFFLLHLNSWCREVWQMLSGQGQGSDAASGDHLTTTYPHPGPSSPHLERASGDPDFGGARPGVSVGR